MAPDYNLSKVPSATMLDKKKNYVGKPLNILNMINFFIFVTFCAQIKKVWYFISGIGVINPTVELKSFKVVLVLKFGETYISKLFIK